jgi:hypothetical protein
MLFDPPPAERAIDADQVSSSTSRQNACTVQWSDCIAASRSRRVARVRGTGPGLSLVSMWNRHYPDLPAGSVNDVGSAEAVVRGFNSRTVHSLSGLGRFLGHSSGLLLGPGPRAWTCDG